MGKKYLIYLDILGFKKKAAEIAEKTGFEIARDQEIFELTLICPEEYEQCTMMEQQEVQKGKGPYIQVEGLYGTEISILNIG